MERTPPKITRLRQWLPSLPLNDSARSICLKVLSYNVLADSNLAFTRDLYPNGEHLLWKEKRALMIFEELKHINADIVCLQEVDQRDIADLMVKGYDHEYAKRPLFGKSEGQMTLWRKSMFKLVEKYEVPFNFDPESDLYTNGQICLITVLEVAPATMSPFLVIVANVHLCYNHRRGDIKLAQTNLVLSCLAEIKKYYSTIGVKAITFLCGDFNSSPSSGIFRFITQGTYDCRSFQTNLISGQEESRIRFGKEKALTADFPSRCNEILRKAAYLSPPAPLDTESVDRLTYWYMAIINTYVNYDFIRKRLKPKYKLNINKVYEYNKKRKLLTHDEKRKLRELFCKNIEEIDELMDEDHRTHDLFTYVLEAPLKFKSAYSEVGRGVYQYIRSYPKIDPALPYKSVEDERVLKTIIGKEFNGIYYEDLRSPKSEDMLKLHSMESSYSHCVECIMKCDYIFFEGEGLTAVLEYEIPHYTAMVQLEGLCPNVDVPSDHFPVAAVFYYSP